MSIKTKCKWDDSIVCPHVFFCEHCLIWEKLNRQVEDVNGRCQICGADTKIWREKFGVEHICLVGGK